MRKNFGVEAAVARQAGADYDREQKALNTKDKFLREQWDEINHDPYYFGLTEAEMKGTKMSVACIEDEHGVDIWYEKVGDVQLPVLESDVVTYYVVKAVDDEENPGRCVWEMVRGSNPEEGQEEVAA